MKVEKQKCDKCIFDDEFIELVNNQGVCNICVLSDEELNGLIYDIKEWSDDIKKCLYVNRNKLFDIEQKYLNDFRLTQEEETIRGWIKQFNASYDLLFFYILKEIGCRGNDEGRKMFLMELYKLMRLRDEYSDIENIISDKEV